MDELPVTTGASSEAWSALQQSVRGLRWQVRIMSLLVVAVCLAFLWNQRRGIVSSFVYTDEFNLPIPTAQNLAHSPLAGIARALDHKSIAFWIGSGLFKGARARIDVADTGKASFVFSDARGRERISVGLSEDGTPSIRLLDSSGRVTWNAPDSTARASGAGK